MQSISPNIFVNNINQTIEFYRLLGFDLVMTMPEERDYVWSMMTCGNVNFMFQTFASLGDELPEVSRQDSSSLVFYIKTENIREFFERIKDKAQVLKDLEKTFYGATVFSIPGNNNYVLTFAEDE